MSDGTFGASGELPAMAPELVEAVEQHRFDPLDRLFWRNRDLSFQSPKALLASLEQQPSISALVRSREADDHLALAALARDPDVAGRARSQAAVRLLWEVCQIPDFQKVMSDHHAALLTRIYRHLTDGDGFLPVDWVARQVARIDRTDGDFDTLMARIAHIRTWTYVTHRGDWLPEAAHWQERTRAIEDRLSDALHMRLTQRFVDRRSAVLLRRLRGGEPLLGAVRADGDVLVEGEYVGRLHGLRFVPDEAADREEARSLETAARRALRDEVPRRLRRLEQDAPGNFALDEGGQLLWRGAPVARLARGPGPLAPRVRPLPSDLLDGAQGERLRHKLSGWLDEYVGLRLAPLVKLADAELSGAARGIAFQLYEALGALPRAAVAPQIAALRREDRKALAKLGVRLGEASVFLPALSSTRAVRLRALLWAVHRGLTPAVQPESGRAVMSLESIAGPLLQSGGLERPMTRTRSLMDGYCLALGYRRLGCGDEALAARVDAVERLAKEARKLSSQGAFTVTAALQRAAGCGEDELAVILPELGYRIDRSGPDLAFLPRGVSRSMAARRRKKTGAPTPKQADSPFAKLRSLKIAP
jgi:ATP-dependent RNA helicase SUPV3L1/SUV3